MTRSWVLAIMVLVAPAGSLSAQVSEAAFEEARDAANKNQFGRAADLFTHLASEYEAQYKDSARPLYCARTDAELKAYQPDLDDGGTLVDPHFCDSLFLQAYSYSELGKFDLAVDALKRAVQIAPRATSYWLELGYALGQAKQPNESASMYMAAFNLALEVNDRGAQAKALRGLGYTAIDLGDWSQAETYYKQSLAIDPENEMAKSELEFIAENRPAQ